MQFLPSSWATYGVDANGDGFKDPYNPADAIFAAARYLRAAGRRDGPARRRLLLQPLAGLRGIGDAAREAARRHALGSCSGRSPGLTEARFPVHAKAHFTDGFPTRPSQPAGPQVARRDDDLLRSRRAGDRRAGRADRADRRLARARALRLAARRLRQHLHLRETRQRRPALPGAQAARRQRPATRTRRSPTNRSNRAPPAPPAPARRPAPSPRPAKALRRRRCRSGSRAALEATAPGSTPTPQPSASAPASESPGPRPAAARRRRGRPASADRQRHAAGPPSSTPRVFRDGPNDVYLHDLHRRRG